jgi:hypothetical protein
MQVDGVMKPPKLNEDESSRLPIPMPPKVVSVEMERMCQWELVPMVSIWPQMPDCQARRFADTYFWE